MDGTTARAWWIFRALAAAAVLGAVAGACEFHHFTGWPSITDEVAAWHLLATGLVAAACALLVLFLGAWIWNRVDPL